MDTNDCRAVSMWQAGAQRLEAVSDHSAQTLLATLKRFIARRGIPSDVTSDRGKNFKGIANCLKQIFQILRSEEIQNFRTSAPPSPDPSDVKAFTSGHFLIGIPLLDLPDEASSTNLRLPFRWNWLQQIKQVFWKRWSRDYLHHLQSRPKRYSQRIKLQVGDWVVIHDILRALLIENAAITKKTTDIFMANQWCEVQELCPLSLHKDYIYYVKNDYEAIMEGYAVD
ncbi:integrase catalytic domain-containing protein [Trichonephila inaurata madagascariensis]|uniref:Integrase catalytic domain-containing protein n=1 Tax=Trichonephila inaurata madagascariensis TaxID=2747483 RepID=A0A8X6WWF6_9ARAC|nr:integrase catalytic domain-containing protein [Trichonephila inaurata madagascariensis]